MDEDSCMRYSRVSPPCVCGPSTCLVKADIQQHQSQLTQLYEQNERILGELAIKKQTLADVEVKAKCACSYNKTNSARTKG